MAQRAAQRRRSEFPIFEYIEAANPVRIWNEFQALPSRRRWTIVTMIAFTILVLIVSQIGIMAIQHHLATRGAFLNDALEAPYGLANRPVPVVEANDKFFMLPMGVGAFARQPEVDPQVQQAAREAFETAVALVATRQAELRAAEAAFAALPAPEAPAAAEQPADAAVIVEPSAEYLAAAEAVTLATEALAAAQTALADLNYIEPMVYPLSECLEYAALSDRARSRIAEAPCTPGRRPIYIETAQYLRGNEAISVTAAQYADHLGASVAMSDLYLLARPTMRIGNFTIGVAALDYMYSGDGTQAIFTWSHQEWVYTIAGPNFNVVEQFVLAFPY